jgi:hypothetical protein
MDKNPIVTLPVKQGPSSPPPKPVDHPRFPRGK